MHDVEHSGWLLCIHDRGARVFAPTEKNFLQNSRKSFSTAIKHSPT